ncbi:caspase, EACC1-associated type [Streptomyces anulatus]|uniref:caspase, EACC1-associated type n=1 Tax=Streptomyces anulatus TaxID=1892 RepID=UPI002254C27C|nr:transporter substrate-binding domain-containing protein [Streptomyces anulatus]MCX4506304.1 transporter substrate-binding domain-containing protein [Streptomyces anulatus]
MTSTKQPPAPNGDESTSPLAGAGLPDPSGTRIVLIGAGRFNELHPLPATRRNVEDLADLITAAWNLPVANCTVLRDPASPRDLSRAVEEAAKEATDTLLVYYAGHGLIDWSGHFHLAVRSSERESVHDTAVPYAWVKEHIEKSRAERRIVILDCCYAARAFGLQSDSALFEVAGTYVLAAASETATAVSPPGEEFTAFTGALLTVLRNGIPDLPRYLDLDSIFRRLSKELTLRNRPRPSKQCRDHLGYTPFIRNAAYAPYGDASLSAVPAQQRPPSETSGTGTPPSYTPATSRADAVPRRTGNISDGNPIQVMRRKAVRLVGLPAAALALLLGGYSVFSVSPEDSPQIRQIHGRKTINVGVKADQPGLASETAPGKWEGFEIDLAYNIAASLGFPRNKVEFEAVETKDRDRLLQNGTVDFVVATWTVDGSQATKARKHSSTPLIFVGPYFKTSLSALVWATKERAASVEGIDDIGEKYDSDRICTATGSTSEDYLNKKNIEHTAKPSYQRCWDDSKVHVVITDEIILAGLNQENDFRSETGSEVKKGHVIRLADTVESYGVGILAGDPIFEYLTCQAIPKDWESNVSANLEKMATEHLDKEWTRPTVKFPECSRLDAWKYKMRNFF